MKCIHCNKKEPNKESGLCDECELVEAGKINGVLYLPALGLVLGIIGGGFEIYNFIEMVLNHFNETGFISYYAMGGFVFLIAGFVISFYAAWLFFRRKQGTRSMMIIYYVSGLIMALYFTVLPATLFSIHFNSDSIRLLCSSILGVAIWIPYFLLSKRIKTVFCR